MIKAIATYLGIAEARILPVSGYPSYYITACGKVVSCKRSKLHVMKTGKTNSGYNRVALSRGGKAEGVYPHHLVLENFVGNRPDGNRARFKDGKKDNMALDNLEWRPKTANQGAEPYSADRSYVPDEMLAKIAELSQHGDTEGLREFLGSLMRP